MAKTLSKRITKSVVNNLEPDQLIRDTELKGFGVRRQAHASIYFLQKRVKNRVRWITIGPHGAPWTPETARKQALKLLAQIADGKDPSQQQKLDKHKLTFSNLIDLFMADHGFKLKPRTRQEYERLLEKFIRPAFGKKQIHDITRSDVSQFHAKLAHTPYQANFTLRVLSKLMTWAEEQGHRDLNSNPCLRIKLFREKKKERFLSVKEFARLGLILDIIERNRLETPFLTAAIRLYIFTGARRSEILTLKWSYVDFERQALRLPDPKTGNKVIQLNEYALNVLRNIPRIKDNPYVIIGSKEGQYLIGIQKQWNRIRNLARIPDVRLHDLRHSFASIVASSGGSLYKLGALLGHSNPQTTARYAHLFDDPLRVLNQNAGSRIAEIMGGNR